MANSVVIYVVMLISNFVLAWNFEMSIPRHYIQTIRIENLNYTEMYFLKTFLFTITSLPCSQTTYMRQRTFLLNNFNSLCILNPRSSHKVFSTVYNRKGGNHGGLKNTRKIQHIFLCKHRNHV